MVHVENPTNTEVDAYSYIKTELEKLDWIVKNPARFPDGEVYKQNEVLANIELKKLLGRDMPEAVVKITENKFWVIESKRDIHNLDDALEEAKNQYAAKINISDSIDCIIVSGVAGNDSDGYEVSNLFLKDGNWEKILINGEEKTSLLSKNQVKYIIDNNTNIFEDIPEISEKKYLTAAEEINKILHLASINKSKRARFISGIILSYAASTKPNLDKNTVPLVKEINDNIEEVLTEKGKSDFFDFVKLELPPNTDNHIKYKQAIIQTYRELNRLDIKSAMNSGDDVLGKFYEVFLKYGNGAKEIGIVLTPRHITKFAVDVLDIKHDDYVFDPTCGTGGFLVSAFDYVKSNSTEDQINIFKEHNLFGIEQEDDVVALALVNMIFRGDGRHNIKEGNCLSKNIVKTIDNGITTGKYVGSTINDSDEPIITKVLMNPPFALKSSDEKEFLFVEHALKQMQRNGILFTVLPYSCLTKQGRYKKWRENLLQNNTLLSVITFPHDLFYPVGVNTVGIFIKKGVPHQEDNNVFWIRALNDGFLKNKGKRLFNDGALNDFPPIENLLKSFILNTNLPVETIHKKQIACPINQDDPTSEYVPEVYLKEDVPSEIEIEKDLDDTLRNLISTMIGQDRTDDFLDKVVTENLFDNISEKSPESFESMSIVNFFTTPIETGDYHASNILNNDNIPLISCSTLNGGVEGYFEMEKLHNNVITIASDGQPLTSFYHYYDVGVKDNVLICYSNKTYRFTTILYLVSQLNRLKWRFSYGRKAYKNKVDKIYIHIPISNNTIDEDYIEYLVKKQPSWRILKKLFT